MPNETAVINASPFILLSKCGLIGLLPLLFYRILIPNAVFEEVAAGNDISSKLIHELERTWLNRVTVSIVREVELWNLGDGETEVLSFALDKTANLALIDDRAARRCAITLGINTLGTAGLLILAKKRSLAPLVKPELEKLELAGLYISNEVRQAILEQAGEI